MGTVVRPGVEGSTRNVSAHRLRTWLIGVAGVVAILIGGFYMGGAWYLSSKLDSAALDAASLRAASANPSYPATVTVLANRSAGADPLITLTVPDPPDQFLTSGTWGLEASDGGYGQVGAIESRSAGTVSRIFHQMAGPGITAGKHVRIDNIAFPQDPMTGLGIPFDNVEYPGPLGSYPAWYMSGTSPDWAILVHGKSLLRQDMLRLVGPIHRAGLPELVITIRNDPGAPPDPSGKVRYGETEWQDVQAAAQYALDHGARRLVLVGVSMGGGIVASFLYRSRLASQVSAVILDSPMLDFSQSVDHAAAAETLPVVGVPVPDSLVAVGKWMTSWRFGVDWAALDYLAKDSLLKAPILLFQGTVDDFVPQSVSDELAADRPDLVTYVVTGGAGHVDSWNLDPARYERMVSEFIASHG